MAPVDAVPVTALVNSRRLNATQKARRTEVNQARHREAKAVQHAERRAALTVADVPPRPFREWTDDEKAAVWDAVLENVSQGHSYRSACEAHGLDARSYWRDWVSRGRESDLDEARVAQADVHVDRSAARIHDLMALDPKALSMPQVARTKLAVDHDKWMAAVTAPKRYGPKVQVEKTVRKLVVELRDESGESFRVGGEG